MFTDGKEKIAMTMNREQVMEKDMRIIHEIREVIVNREIGSSLGRSGKVGGSKADVRDVSVATPKPARYMYSSLVICYLLAYLLLLLFVLFRFRIHVSY